MDLSAEGLNMFRNLLARALRLAAVMTLLATAVLPEAAQAQSPPPFGLWQGANSGDFLLIQTNGSCSASGTVNVAGRCQWIPSARGGILNMFYPMPLAPGRIGWSIIWLDRNTLMVNGVERFLRRR
jgi:hypothetical protein